MKKLSFATIIAISLLGTSATVSAEDLYINKKIGVVSNYVYRGMTQSDEKASAQANIYLEKNNFYGGGIVAQVDFGTNDKYEIDYYGGYLYSINKFNLDLQYYVTNYDGDTKKSEEITVGLKFPCKFNQDLEWDFKYTEGLDKAPNNYNIAGEYNLKIAKLKANYNDYDTVGITSGLSLSKTFNISSNLNIDTSLSYSSFTKESNSYYEDQENLSLSVMLSF